MYKGKSKRKNPQLNIIDLLNVESYLLFDIKFIL